MVVICVCTQRVHRRLGGTSDSPLTVVSWKLFIHEKVKGNHTVFDNSKIQKVGAREGGGGCMGKGRSTSCNTSMLCRRATVR